jgi:hypothetical protein
VAPAATSTTIASINNRATAAASRRSWWTNVTDTPVAKYLRLPAHPKLAEDFDLGDAIAILYHCHSYSGNDAFYGLNSTPLVPLPVIDRLSGLAVLLDLCKDPRASFFFQRFLAPRALQ